MHKKSPACGAFSTTKTALCGDYLNVLAVVGAAHDKLHLAIGGCKQRVIATDTDVFTGVEAGAALTNQDIPSQNLLTAETLHTKALAFRIPSVSGTTTSFLVCHDSFSSGLCTPTQAEMPVILTSVNH